MSESTRLLSTVEESYASTELYHGNTILATGQKTRQRSLLSQSTGTLTSDNFQKKTSIYHHLKKLYYCFSTSLYLENKASVARDHLANERTYLAWVRTSLSMIAVGVAITQVFRLHKDNATLPEYSNPSFNAKGRSLGLVFIMFGICFILFAVIRYFHSQTAMTKGYFPASRGIVVLTSLSTLAALIAIFIMILLHSQ
ncbi:uncharacterized protein B0P05DRAFT_525876 [Gilbertella persicaria]|uniref:uncharacterized protein n=1 Tax=Gilbertella persicaria TaxID=101096 RepID=UPI002220CD45|nr:uncharacterized protein B0P05DRAFT_525876 [Gilbertella persicaria]KAI8092345.1 hypothetical protein B0P05DRAFT_525876 [Gilbertella persicaria]